VDTEGLTDADGDWDADGLTLAETEALGLWLADGLCDRLALDDGLCDADGETDGLGLLDGLTEADGDDPAGVSRARGFGRVLRRWKNAIYFQSRNAPGRNAGPIGLKGAGRVLRRFNPESLATAE